jgi:thioredoxin-related protein
VLLTFWSSASEDCVAENIELKQLYGIYSKKGFEIYQINLDANEEVWKKAVKFDELPWISVREDDPQNPVNANIYNVKSLPTNYLYDKTGSIVASNIHGRNLQLKLSQVFGN